ncbi:MAG: ribonuclease E/G, partial [Acidobacteria bacterium]|nr:ribonuclease E/G [Acidobacteriota bacterium]
MNKELIVSSSRHETMAAILEDDQVAEIHIEREHQRGVVGNIYKGRVNKVLPGMQSAFVDIGLERDAFLYVSDVVDTIEEFERLESGDGDDAPASDGESNGDAARSRSNGRGRAVQRSAQKPTQQIEDLLKAGQEILVQVVKEPLGTKGARVTSHASIPGRFLVFMPTADNIGVSRKIDLREERSRLRGIVRQFREEHGFTGGIIIRTAAAKRPKEDIEGDLRYFHDLWSEMRGDMESLRAPAVIHHEESLVSKLIRDFLSDDFSAIRIDSREEYARVV